MKMNDEFWRHNTVMVTGGSGFLGRRLVDALLSSSARVEVLDIANPTTQKGDFVFHQTDLCDLRGTIQILEERRPRVMIHLAGQAGVSACDERPAEAFERNVLCTFNVLEACRSYGEFDSIVVVSSNHVYGEQTAMPTLENAPLNGVGMYATSKLCGDILTRAYGKTYGLPVSIARITNSYGPDDPHAEHIITGSILSALQGEVPVIEQRGKDTKGYLYVKDTVNGILTLAEQTAVSPVLHGEAFNIVPDSPVSVKDLVKQIVAVVGLECEPIVLRPTAEYEEEYLDNRKARRLLRWTPQFSLLEGLVETVGWFREHSSQDSTGDQARNALANPES